MFWPYNDHSTWKQAKKQRKGCAAAGGVSGFLSPTCLAWPYSSWPPHGELLLAPGKQQCWAGPSAWQTADWWCGKETLPFNEKEGPYFCTFFFLLKLGTHAAACQAQANISSSSESDRHTAGLKAGWHLWTWPHPTPFTEQGQLQQFSWELHPGMFWIFPSMELSSLSEQPVVNLYIVPAKPKSPFSLQKLKKAPFSSSCRDNAAFHLMCNCRWF